MQMHAACAQSVSNMTLRAALSVWMANAATWKAAMPFSDAQEA